MDKSQKGRQRKEETHTTVNAPSYMQPQKPVLDEPLDAGEEAPEVVTEAEEVEEVEEGEDIPLEVEPVEPEETDATKPPYSPYFPRGVYEDAQAVEEFYGRGLRSARPHDLTDVILSPNGI